MSIKDALGFELFNAKQIFKDLKDDPKRIFLGVDPISTKGWNAILGRNDEPIVGHLGAAKPENFAKAEAQGIDTSNAQALHKGAQTVAGIWGTAGAAGGLGNAWGSMMGGAPANAAVGGSTAGGGAGAVGAEAIPEVVISATRTAPIATAAAAGAGGAGAASQADKGFNWQKLLTQGGNMMQQQGQSQQQQEEAAIEALARQGPPPAMGGSNVGLVPIDQYQESMSPVRRALG